MRSIFRYILASAVFFFSTNNSIQAVAYPNIADYWNGIGEFSYRFKLTSANTGWQYGVGGGAQVIVVDSTWYLITRNNLGASLGTVAKPNCTYSQYATIAKSTDEGKTWSNAIEMLPTVSGSPWECINTDGGLYYNQAENKWHFLFQCVDRNWKWDTGCHATRDGRDPYGPFTPDPNNPVIKNSSIWSKICNTPTDDCVSIQKNTPGSVAVSYEGTYDIFDYKDGYYYVGFHGFDHKNGYRGIARSKDFINWEPVANDSVLDPKDAINFKIDWHDNKSIGFGASRIIKKDNYYYQLAEAADLNLVCTPGQNWVWGLFRSNTLSSTTWEQLPRSNPFLTINHLPDKDPNVTQCNPGYAGLFTSASGKTYLHTNRETNQTPQLSGMYFYELTTIPQPPTQLTANCQSDGKVQLNWQNPGDFATYYQIRIDDTSNAWTNSCTNINSGDYCQNLPSSSFIFNYKPNNSYRWWLHACNSTGCTSPGVDGASFSCANTSASPSPQTTINGDLNADGYVNLSDFNMLISQFGTVYTLFDYNNIIANFGKNIYQQ